MGRLANLPAIPEGDYGPKMRALPSIGMQRFVLALMNQGQRNYSAAYAEAYGRPDKPPIALKVDAHRLAHDERIQAAIQEEAGRRVKTLLPLALHVVEQVMTDPQNKDAAKVALGILDRSGLAAAVEHKITVGLAGDTEMLARIKMLAERNGIPIEQYIGASLAKTIEHVPSQSLTLETEVDEFADEQY